MITLIHVCHNHSVWTPFHYNVRKLHFMYELVRTSSKYRWSLYRTSGKCRWSIYRTSRKRRGTLQVEHKSGTEFTYSDNGYGATGMLEKCTQLMINFGNKRYWSSLVIIKPLCQCVMTSVNKNIALIVRNNDPWKYSERLRCISQHYRAVMLK